MAVTRTISSTAPFRSRGSPAISPRTSSLGRSTLAPARSAARRHGGRRASGFELTQRADFFEEEVGLETTLKRPIINTRDEPHADPQKYRRLHVITGDANLAEVATFLKVGVTALVLAMIEDDVPRRSDLVLARPVAADARASRTISTLRTTLELASGESLTALELQWELYDLGRKYAAERAWRHSGPKKSVAAVLDRWEAVLHGLESDPRPSRASSTGSPSYELVEAYRERHDLRLGRPEVAALDLQYHDLRPDKSLFSRLAMERLARRRGGALATSEPPPHDAGLLPRPSASSGSPPRSWPPTGTRSCSTSARIRSAVCR